MTAPHRALVAGVRDGLARLADPARAGPMQAYMKSQMPYRGVPTPQRRRLCREVFADHPIHDRDTWTATVITLWDEASFREERYAAVDLTGVRTARSWQDPDTVPMYDHMIVTGAWWDYVDDLAIRRVGPIVLSQPVPMRALIRDWAVDENLWRRRSAIIAQVGAKSRTDVDLLAEVILANLGNTPLTQNFFVRKGIGWALREYAKYDPSWVGAFVDEHRGRLSPLSVREATKHL